MQNHLKLKGISPLVAAVLLIAVTMTIAGVLAYWASSFVRTQTSLFQNETIATECNFGNFIVHTCSFVSNSSQINLILSNTGTIDLRDINAFVIYPNGSVPQYTLNGSLPTKTLKPYSLTGVSGGYSKINIRTQCPNVFTEVSC